MPNVNVTLVEKDPVCFAKMKERVERFREEPKFSFAAQSVLAKYRLIDAPAEPIVLDEHDSHSSEETADLGSLVKAGMFVGDPCADMTEVGARETLRDDLEIKASNIRGAGLGVFAKVPISSGTTVGSYWGALKSVPFADKCDLGEAEEHSRWVKMKKTTIIDKKKYR
ncbi:MAG: hypothetical protein JW384_03165 [Nitrosomonadaceae bacterium]|nr:hypothetical protein [Nitrosomonadaceae bacterium]